MTPAPAPKRQAFARTSLTTSSVIARPWRRRGAGRSRAGARARGRPRPARRAPAGATPQLTIQSADPPLGDRDARQQRRDRPEPEDECSVGVRAESERTSAYVCSSGMMAAARSVSDVSTPFSSTPSRSASRVESRWAARVSETMLQAVVGAAASVLATRAPAIAAATRASRVAHRPSLTARNAPTTAATAARSRASAPVSTCGAVNTGSP